MSERRIVRVDGGAISVATEARFESELFLHETIAAHPEVLPSEDLGMGPLVTLASELDLGHGPIDTLAADSLGRLVIIEFKRGSENPDVRKVVAQVLDYGSALWKRSYEDLEGLASRCSPGFDSTLSDHVSRQLALLGVETFDPDAFERGVRTCLDSGDFVFLYVGRDLDERTRRIMRYLAEGPRMTFFAVEVDYFREPDRSSSILVPRAAFVPSWVNEHAERHGRSSPPPVSLREASAATRELVSLMDDFAAEHGLVATNSRAARIYRPARNATGLSVYLGGDGTVDLDVEVLRRQGDPALADELLDAISEATGHRPSTVQYPTVPVAAVLGHWEKFLRQVAEPYFDARSRHVQTDNGLDISVLHAVLDRLPTGHWTTYGDLSEIAGGHPKGLGSHIRACDECRHAWRVLDASGRVSAGFTWTDASTTDTPEQRLRAEGVTLVDERATPEQRLSVDALRGLLEGN